MYPSSNRRTRALTVFPWSRARRLGVADTKRAPARWPGPPKSVLAVQNYGMVWSTVTDAVWNVPGGTEPCSVPVIAQKPVVVVEV